MKIQICNHLERARPQLIVSSGYSPCLPDHDGRDSMILMMTIHILRWHLNGLPEMNPFGSVINFCVLLIVTGVTNSFVLSFHLKHGKMVRISLSFKWNHDTKEFVTPVTMSRDTKVDDNADKGICQDSEVAKLGGWWSVSKRTKVMQYLPHPLGESNIFDA